MKPINISILIILPLFFANCSGLNHSFKKKKWDQVDTELAITSSIMTSLDIYSTVKMLENPNNWEMNPIMGRRPSKNRIYFTMGLTQALILGLTYILPPKLRKVLLGTKIIANKYGFIKNLTLEQ